MCRGSMHHTKNACRWARVASTRTQMLNTVLGTPTSVVVHPSPMSARGVQQVILNSQGQVRQSPQDVCGEKRGTRSVGQPPAIGTTSVTVHWSSELC